MSKYNGGEDLEGSIKIVLSIIYSCLKWEVNKAYFVFWTVSGWKILFSNNRNPIQTIETQFKQVGVVKGFGIYFWIAQIRTNSVAKMCYVLLLRYIA